MTTEKLMSISKEDINEAAKRLEKTDLPDLVEMLSLKEDNIRYQAFLLLMSRSAIFNDVYPFWDIFCDKIKSENSYQRSIGLMLIAENARWDTRNRTEGIIDDYLVLLQDEKPITVRQCVQSLGKIVAYKPELSCKIASKLISFDISAVRETMRKVILFDILNVLILIRQKYKTDEMESFIQNALSSGILDEKSKKMIKVLL
ncbi:MAG: hypothetical protein GX148_02860 [Clostridiales bacterium]|jgi:hypothetical protein|nr:hypothetical protein [Clostridiales bacterium]